MAPLEGFKASVDLPIPTNDMISWIYDNGANDDLGKPLYYDGADNSRSWNKIQGRSTVRKLVAGLRSAGMKPGDCCLIHSFNDINYPLLVQGIVAVGGIFTGSNPAYTVGELEHQINTAEVKFVFAEPEILNPIIKAAQKTGLLSDHIFVFNNTSTQNVPTGYKSWKQLLTHGEEDWVRFDSKEISEKTPACRLFSSGTTGSPKAVQLTHYNLMAQHVGVMTADRRPYERIYIDSMPIFNASATPRLHFQNVREGHVTHLLRRFDLNNVLQLIQDKKATELIIVPAVAITLVMDENTRKYDLSSVRTVLIGSAPLDKSIQDRLREEVLSPGTRVVQGWGMTELCCTGTLFTWPEDDSTASIGRPINGLEMKLLDDDDRELRAYDTPGEILVRGPSVTKGYYNNEAANAQTFKDGWLRTGDIAHCDSKSKKWYIVDRKKELIKVRGFQVGPIEVEGVLLLHPGIVDAAVIGIPAEPLEFAKSEKEKRAAISGELIRAYVVRRLVSGDQLREEDVLTWVSKRLANYKQITGGVIFVDMLPRNATGKIMKKELRDRAKMEMKRSAGPRL